MSVWNRGEWGAVFEKGREDGAPTLKQDFEVRMHRKFREIISCSSAHKINYGKKKSKPN